MNHHTYRRLVKALSVVINLLIIISMVGQALLPVVAYAAVPVRSLPQEPVGDSAIQTVTPTPEPTPSPKNDSNQNIYIPIIITESSNPSDGPQSDSLEIFISAAQGGTLQAPDGTTITVPPGAFAEDGYLRYIDSPPTSTITARQTTPRGFELQAFTKNKTPLTRFLQPVTGYIPYDYTDIRGSFEDSLQVYFVNDNQQWQPLPSQVDLHRFQVVFTTTHTAKFGLMASPMLVANDAACDDAQVGRGSPEVKAVMCEAFIRAGGKGAMGVAQSDSSGDVHSWGSGLVQDFTGGTLFSPVIFYRTDIGTAYYMSRDFVIPYANQAGGPSGFLGLPIGDQRPDGPTWFKDDENDFRAGPIMSFQHGFIGYDQQSGAFEAHRNFPKIKEYIWETFWEPTGATDSDNNPYYQFKVKGTVQTAEAAPEGKDNPSLTAGFWVRTSDKKIDGGQLSLGIGQAGEVTFSPAYTEPQKYEYYFFVYRNAPDNLSGYVPCAHAYADPADKGWLKRTMATYSSGVVTVDCKGGEMGIDAPPEISLLSVWPNGEGDFAVNVLATDDIGIKKVVLKSNDPQTEINMEPWPSAGPGVYSGKIVNGKVNQQVQFTATAYDTSNQTASVDETGKLSYSSKFGIQKNNCYSGNPVNCGIGNDTDTYIDLVVPGPGGTDIIISRNTNSQDDRNGPFGRSSSFEYDMALEFVDNILLSGIQVRYGDGHTANFQATGSNRYDPISAGNFSYMMKEGSRYVLYQKDLTRYIFNSDGKLIEIRTKNDAAITLTYNGAGKIATITNASGRTVSLSWAGEYIVQVTGPAGKLLTYQYAGNLLTAFTDAKGQTTTYQHDAAGRVIKTITPKGHVHAEQAFDDRGRVIWQVVGQTERRDFSYHDDTHTTTVTDANDNTITYIHDEAYQIMSVVDAKGQANHSTYDNRGNRLTYTDRRGHTWRYEYDAWGNKTKQIDPLPTTGDVTGLYDSDVTVWEYNSNHQPTKMTDALGNVIRYTYDDKGNLSRIDLPDGSVMRLGYNSYGQVTSIEDGKGNVTTNDYHPVTGDLIKIINPAGDTTQFGYDALGRQISITDDNDHTITIEYDNNDNIVRVVDAKGEDTQFTYDSNDNLVKTTDRRGGVTTQSYNASDRLSSVTDPVGAETSYDYDLMGHVKQITNPRDKMIAFWYDENYNVVQMQDEADEMWAYQHDENNNQTREMGPLNQRTDYSYDALNRLKFVRDALGYTTEYCYNALDQLVRLFDPRRAESRFEYDPMGRLSRYINPLGEVDQWAYDLAGNLASQTNGENETTYFEYDEANRRLKVIDPLANITQFAYDGVGNITSVIDGNDNPTHYDYDANNNLVALTNALTFTVSLGYNEEDQQRWVQESDGDKTSFDYYLDGQLQQLIEPDGATTTYNYDPNKNLSELINANNQSTTYSYNDRDQVTTITDPLGHTTRYGYDELGRLIAEIDAENKPTYYDYDALSQLIAVTDAADQTTRYGYDQVGNMTAITYSNFSVSTFIYNFNDQLIREIDPLSQTRTYRYDEAGRIIRRTDGQWRVTHYQYDDAGRLIETWFGNEGSKRIQFEHDGVGNVIAMTDWNGTLTREFDALSRPVAETDYMGRTVGYAWNPDGSRQSLTYPDGRVLSYTYNANNQLATLTLPDGQTADYQYDPLGYLTDLTYSNGTTAEYGYDAANRLTSLHNSGPDGGVMAWYDYVLDNVGNRTQIMEQRLFTPDNPIETIQRRYRYDELHRLVGSNSELGDGTTYEMAWQLDSVGNWEERAGNPEPASQLVGLQKPTDSNINTTYEHNPLNSLVQTGDWTYQYDDNGNRVVAAAPLTATRYATLTTTFGPQATLLTSYEYDYENRLTHMEQVISYWLSDTARVSPTMQAEYIYDGLGRRTEKYVTTTLAVDTEWLTTTVDGISTTVETIQVTSLQTPTVLHRQYLFDGLDKIAEYEEIQTFEVLETSKVSITSHYYRANDRIVAHHRETTDSLPTTRWYHHDGLGSVVALTDDSGELTTAYQYDEYGLPLTGDLSQTHHTYTGQEFDPELGFYHFYARYYDPANGVWLTQDVYRGEVDDPLSLHRYGYVENNPTNFFDRWGFNKCDRYNLGCKLHYVMDESSTAIGVAAQVTRNTLFNDCGGTDYQCKQKEMLDLQSTYIQQLINLKQRLLREGCSHSVQEEIELQESKIQQLQQNINTMRGYINYEYDQAEKGVKHIQFVADVTWSVHPWLAPFYNLSQALSGENWVTGERLDNLNRSLALVSAVSGFAGFVPGLTKSEKILNIVEKAKTVTDNAEVILTIEKIALHISEGEEDKALEEAMKFFAGKALSGNGKNNTDVDPTEAGRRRLLQMDEE